MCGHEKDTADRACGARGNATHHKPSSDVIRTRRRIIRHPHRRLSHVEAVALAKGAAGGAVVHDGWQIRGRARRGLAEILRPLLRRARVDLGLIEACGFAKARHAGRSLHAGRLRAEGARALLECARPGHLRLVLDVRVAEAPLAAPNPCGLVLLRRGILLSDRANIVINRAGRVAVEAQAAVSIRDVHFRHARARA